MGLVAEGPFGARWEPVGGPFGALFVGLPSLALCEIECVPHGTTCEVPKEVYTHSHHANVFL